MTRRMGSQKCKSQKMVIGIKQNVPCGQETDSPHASSDRNIIRRAFVKYVTAAIGIVGLSVSGAASVSGQESGATVFQGGTVLTVDEEFSVAEAFAVKGNKILAVGSDADVRVAAGPNAKIVDLVQ